MALVFSNPSEPDAAMEPSVTHLRCCACKEVKPCCACPRGECSHNEPSSFPPSCAKWRRGACKQCRMAKAREIPLLKRKLDSARRRYGAGNQVTLAYVERLLTSRCPQPWSDEELSRWRLVKKDENKPFTPDNVEWTKRGDASR